MKIGAYAILSEAYFSGITPFFVTRSMNSKGLIVIDNVEQAVVSSVDRLDRIGVRL